MREIVLYPGESVTIGDTVVKAIPRSWQTEAPEIDKAILENPSPPSDQYRHALRETGWGPCFCPGPRPGESLCPCAMKQAGFARGNAPSAT